MNERISNIINFWFNDKNKAFWFSKNVEFDKYITNHFQKDYFDAKNHQYDDWLKEPISSLALILLFDQFPRNMFRNDRRAFETDDKAVAITKHMLSHHDLDNLKDEQIAFILMPLMHSEKKKDQALSVKLFKKHALISFIPFAIEHKNIIDRFDRFPHRNAILKRISTKDELAFLKEHSGF